MPQPVPQHQVTFTRDQLALARKVAGTRAAPHREVLRAKLTLIFAEQPTLPARPRSGSRRSTRTSRWCICRDGAQEARLLALACSPVPEGRERWGLRLLAEQVVELGIVEAVSHETVRQVLGRGNSSRT